VVTADNPSVYARCKSSTNYASQYHIRVGTTRTLSTLYAITDTTVSHNTNTSPLANGTYLIADGTGFGVAQAFNILDNAVDAFDYLASASGIAAPTAGNSSARGGSAKRPCRPHHHRGHLSRYRRLVGHGILPSGYWHRHVRE
jgi:hypothetical protein